jgi:hypothetical protein
MAGKETLPACGLNEIANYDKLPSHSFTRRVKPLVQMTYK